MDRNLYMVATALVLLWILVVACFAEPVRWIKRPSIRVRKRQTLGNTMCADPGTPQNGFRIGAVFYRGYSVRFGCNPGYQLAGVRILNCTTGTRGVQWDAKTPRCIPQRAAQSSDPCGAPPLATQFAFQSSYTPGVSVEYQCVNGYVQQSGDAQLTCNNTQWQGELLLCRRLGQCRDYRRINHGYRILNGTTEGSTVFFGCNEGFDLLGNQQLTCGSDGLWTGSWPTCGRTTAECDDPGTPFLGSRQVLGTTEGSVVTYSCNSGFRLVGDSQRTCMATGEWSGSLPFCNRVSCPQLSSPANGRIQFSGLVTTNSILYVGLVASYSCNSGYVLSGANSSTCSENGTWTNDPPRCIYVVCGSLRNPRNGRVRVREKSFGATANYSCFRGYGLMGNPTRTCQSNGIWSGSLPSCVSGTCGSLQDPQNGRVTYTSMTIRSVARYFCSFGYLVSGSSQRICRSSGWSGREPTCEPVRCSMLMPPFNGAVTMTDGNLVFSEATYTCNTGYALIGSSTRQCRPSRIWSSRPPGCYEIRCGALQNPLNGTVVFQDDRNGSEAIYECDQGHVLRFGDRIRTCMENSWWSGDMPCCILVDCGLLTDPDNGRVDFSAGTTFGSTATYECTFPFAVNGTESRLCQANGTWSGEDPVCTEYFCPSLDPPTNGTLTLSAGTSLNSQATYSCFPGNVLTGDSTRTCSRDGWSGVDPTCTFVECPELTAPINGTVSLPTLMAFGFAANYSCINRNTLIGQGQRECTATGQWSGNEPMCQLIECPILQNPANGRVIFNDYIPGELSSYDCDRGFGLRGNARRQCSQTGMWTGSDPTCELAFCPQLDNPTNGRVFVTGLGVQEQAVYICDEGFVIDGLLVRICLDDGEWGGGNPTCTRVVCPNLPNPENGQVAQIINGNVPGTVANYSCDSGYTLVGNMSRVCVQVNREEEVWTGEAPTCQRIICPALSNPVNGEVRITSELPGGVAIYLCNTGFTVSGSLIRVCGNDGLWTTDNPTCAPNNGTVTCPVLLPSSLQNGMIGLSTTTIGSTASYNCFPGYQLDGPATRQCQIDGTWTGNDPVCNPVNCGPLADPVNGVVMIDRGTTFGMTARYSCDAGYVIAGAFALRVCTISGQWSGEAPRCEPIDCGSLTNPLNGMVDLSGGTVLGSQAMYSCMAGYQLEGNSTRLCTIAGEWRPEAPTCALSVGTVDCGDPGTPENGLRNLSSTTTGSTVQYSCQEGYVLQGNSSRICQANGVWSGEIPACVAVMCPLLMRPENGIIFVSGQTAGSRATYFCNNEYTRMGLLQRVCMEDGEWGGQEPVCISTLEIDCPSLESPARGEVIFTNLTVGSTANYTCQSGYMISGVTTRVCQPGGVWSGEEPMCNRVMCGDPGVPLNGRRVGGNFTSGSRVYFVCRDGYNTVGAKVILCQDNGIWDSATPTCSQANNTCTEEGNTVVDQFGRLCNCTNSQLVSCCRYRQDWTSLSMEGKQRYINAVKTIANNSQFQQLYNQLVQTYRSSFDTIAQSTRSAISQFFPWQRYFLLEYEDLLRLIDTRITIPYWDWSLLPNDPYSSPVFDPQSGFGDSSDNTTTCVNSGPFRVGEFEVTASAGGGCLRRLYSNVMYPSRQIVSNILSLQASRFNEFHNSLQLFIQLNIRCFVGGQMCSMDAANDPLYPLHLTRVDIVLDEWQNSSPDRAAARYASEITPLALSFDNSLVVSNFSNNRDLPYGTCIQYAELQAQVQSSQSSIANSARNIQQSDRPSSQRRMDCISEEQMDQLQMSEWEKTFMRRKCG